MKQLLKNIIERFSSKVPLYEEISALKKQKSTLEKKCSTLERELKNDPLRVRYDIENRYFVAEMMLEGNVIRKYGASEIAKEAGKRLAWMLKAEIEKK